MIGDKIYIEEKKPKARNALWIHHCEYNCFDSPFVCHYIDHRGIPSPVVGGDAEAIMKLFRDLSSSNESILNEVNQQFLSIIDRLSKNEADIEELRNLIDEVSKQMTPITNDEINNLV